MAEPDLSLDVDSTLTGVVDRSGVESKLFITDDDDDNDGDKSQKLDNSSSHSRKNSTETRDNADGSTLSCIRHSDGHDEESEDTVKIELAKAFDDLSVQTTESTSTDEDCLSNGLQRLHSPPGNAGHSGVASVSVVDPFQLDDESQLGVMSPLWKSHQRHIFVLSEAGKPIYSRHGNEDKLVTLFGVLQALVSVVQDGDQDSIRSVKVGRTTIVFLIKAPLILVCVSQMGESVAQMQTQLMYFYNQIVSILTSKQLLQIFEKRRNYDLRRLISGSERLLHNLSNLVETDPSFVLGAVKCLPLASSVRDTISQTISQTLCKLRQNVVFAILLANNQLVSLVRMKKCFMHPMDLHIIINLIDASESFKTAETWSPLCLPRFDSSGFVHAHVSYLSDECQSCLVLLTVDRESFFALSEAKQKIVERLKRHNCLEAINASMNNNWPTMSFVNVPEVRHFLYKSRSIAQFMSPALEAPYVINGINSNSSNNGACSSSNCDGVNGSGGSGSVPNNNFSPNGGGSGAPDYSPPEVSKELQRLYSKYYRIHSRLHAQSRPVKLIYWVDDTENWLGWLTTNFELYVTFEPLVKKGAAINAVNKLLKWIKKEEDRIFIMNSPTF